MIFVIVYIIILTMDNLEDRLKKCKVHIAIIPVSTCCYLCFQKRAWLQHQVTLTGTAGLSFIVKKKKILSTKSVWKHIHIIVNYTKYFVVLGIWVKRWDQPFVKHLQSWVISKSMLELRLKFLHCSLNF